jgi:hypothetical protein
LGRVRDPTFHLKDQPLDDLELFQKTEWFQIDPNKSSALFLWTCLLFVVFVFDMIQTPLFIVWPDLFDHLHFLIWFCDFVWAFNIPIRFLSVDYSIESSDPFDIMWNYIGGEFLVDLAATFPSIISGHSVETHILRLLHWVYFKTVYFAPRRFLPKYQHTNLLSAKERSKRFVVCFVLFMMMLSHYLACLWLWIGSRKLMDDPREPWQSANPDFAGANKD